MAWRQAWHRKGRQQQPGWAGKMFSLLSSRFLSLCLSYYQTLFSMSLYISPLLLPHFGTGWGGATTIPSACSLKGPACHHTWADRLLPARLFLPCTRTLFTRTIHTSGTHHTTHTHTTGYYIYHHPTPPPCHTTCLTQYRGPYTVSTYCRSHHTHTCLLPCSLCSSDYTAIPSLRFTCIFAFLCIFVAFAFAFLTSLPFHSFGSLYVPICSLTLCCLPACICICDPSMK